MAVHLKISIFGCKSRDFCIWSPLAKIMSCLLAAAPFRQDLSQTSPFPIIFLTPMTFLYPAPYTPLYYLAGPVSLQDPRISIFVESANISPTYQCNFSYITYNGNWSHVEFPTYIHTETYISTFVAILVIEQSPSLTNSTKNFH